MTIRWSSSRMIIACLVGAVSDILPLPGMLAASVLFPEGIHSSHPNAFIALTLFANFVVVSLLAYFIISLFSLDSYGRSRR